MPISQLVNFCHNRLLRRLWTNITVSPTHLHQTGPSGTFGSPTQPSCVRISPLPGLFFNGHSTLTIGVRIHTPATTTVVNHAPTTISHSSTAPAWWERVTPWSTLDARTAKSASIRRASLWKLCTGMNSLYKLWTRRTFCKSRQWSSGSYRVGRVAWVLTLKIVAGQAQERLWLQPLASGFRHTASDVVLEPLKVTDPVE